MTPSVFEKTTEFGYLQTHRERGSNNLNVIRTEAEPMSKTA
ncbi:MAG: hypothetical protein SFY80_07840 [Verrucomicrobiota bacterium]|nr:hypothetical protein [Verrucomicrobiota bacterium]